MRRSTRFRPALALSALLAAGAARAGGLAFTPPESARGTRVTIDPADGSLTSLYDKLRGKEMVDTSSNYDFNELAASVKSEIDGGQPPVAKPFRLPQPRR